MSAKTYTVSDGELVLTLEPLPEEDGGGYGVTSPLEPQLVTEAKTFEEAFIMARDAIQSLRESRQRYARRIAELAAAET
jgi:predicted RNase H-like HicB family nuclease